MNNEMESKQPIKITRVFILAGAYCAYLIGAAFSSGQEVLQFFATSGVVKGFISALTFMAISLFCMRALYGISQKMQFNNPYDVFDYYSGKYVGGFFAWLSVLVLYCQYIMMLGGAGATLQQYFGTSVSTGTYVVATLAMLTALLGVEKLIDIVGVIGPVEILFIIILAIAAFVELAKQPNLLTINSALIGNKGFEVASGNWLWSGVLYATNCTICGVAFYVMNAQTANSVKEAKMSSMTGVCAFTLAIILLVLTETVYLDVFAINGRQVPTLAIARQISPVLGLIFFVVILVCIYSAVSSIILTVVRKFSVEKTKKFNIITIVLTVIGVLVAQLLPFDKVVNLVLPASGYMGIAFVLFMFYKGFINKKAFPFPTVNKVETVKVEETSV